MADGGRMSLLVLPNEMLMAIGKYLDTPRAVRNFAITNRRLLILIEPLLFNQFATFWRARPEALEGLLLSCRFDNATKLAVLDKVHKLQVIPLPYPNPGIHPENIIRTAVGTGCIPLVKRFLDAGANVNQRARGHGSPLRRAVETNDGKMVAWLLRKRGIKLHDDNEALLTVAARSSAIVAARALIRHAVKHSCKRISDDSTMKTAVLEQNEKLVKLLLTYDKINYNKYDDERDCITPYDSRSYAAKSPFEIACSSDNLEILKVLCNHGTAELDREQYRNQNVSSGLLDVGQVKHIQLAVESGKLRNAEFLHHFVQQQQREDAAFERACRLGDAPGAVDVLERAKLGHWRMRVWMKIARYCRNAGLGLLVCARGVA
ncbi:hypothetical protein PWT90_09644 [Aphanocladium album]|nr:hypothetical protein PWT90_09644 [Aphanocladium album]